MRHRNYSGKKRLGKGFDRAAKAFAILMAIMAILPLASAREAKLNTSKDVSLNITQPLFNESNDGNISYFVQVKNEGATLLKHIDVTDILPPGVVYLSAHDRYESDAPLLKCIVHNADGTTNKLIWYLSSIDTGKDKWLNFTVRKRSLHVNPFQNMVSSNGTALGYVVKGASFQTAEPYFGPMSGEGMSNAQHEVQQTTVAEAVPEKSASNDVSLQTAMPNSEPESGEGMSNADHETQPTAETKVVPEEIASNKNISNGMPSDTMVPPNLTILIPNED